jgi:sugar phosphate isomerase/epimerase
MKIGLSTYAFFWKFHSFEPDAKETLSLVEMIEKTKKLGGDVFQICDYPALESMSEQEILDVVQIAQRLGIEIELGTRGVHPEHLKRYLQYCKLFGSSLLRTMINDKHHTPSIKQAAAWIQQVLPMYEEAGVILAIENYEQLKTKDLLALVQLIDHPNVGICLDPANSVAFLEMPEQVIERLAPYVVNLHIKDFVFARKEGWVGFSYIGCPLGEGLLDLDFMLKSLSRAGKNPNAIIELWLPFTDSMQRTNELENEWIEKSMEYLKMKTLDKITTY